ncbi:ATP-dependent Clp protease adaptor [Planctomycetes bacterium MalM25]|nr:ATP-dependent Clp protease adaptor [Planctomycetes bacterium MalM25]
MDDPLEDDRPEDGTATLVRPQKTPEKERKRKGIPRYHVILWDDEGHTFDYVIRMLQELFGHPPGTGEKLAEAVNLLGRVTVLTTTKEHAELKVEQVTAYGEIAGDDSVGSMIATIEPDES